MTASTHNHVSTATAILSSILRNNPPKDIFNYKAALLFSVKKQRYDAYKNPNMIIPLDQLTTLTWSDGDYLQSFLHMYRLCILVWVSPEYEIGKKTSFEVAQDVADNLQESIKTYSNPHQFTAK
jgi:hypothetical protein